MLFTVKKESNEETKKLEKQKYYNKLNNQNFKIIDTIKTNTLNQTKLKDTITINSNIKNVINHNNNNNESIINIIKNNLKNKLKNNVKNNFKNINDNFEIENKVLPNNINLIQKLTNVYQENYKHGIKITGFGDFIRGCYFVLQFCNKNNKSFEIIINHPLSKYLKTNFNKTVSNEILLFNNINFNTTLDSENNILNISNKNTINDFISYLNTCFINDSNVFIYSISFPVDNVNITEKNYMRNILEPSEQILIQINTVLNNLHLTKYEYNIIHIRSGDDHLNNNNSMFSKEYINNIINRIKHCIQTNENYLLISDNNYIKKVLNLTFPFIKYYIKEITHFGEGIKQEDEKVQNTMLDFYIMSLSKAIFSFSCYEHGSGFSKWCAITYDIPYSCKLVKL